MENNVIVNNVIVKEDTLLNILADFRDKIGPTEDLEGFISLILEYSWKHNDTLEIEQEILKKHYKGKVFTQDFNNFCKNKNRQENIKPYDSNLTFEIFMSRLSTIPFREFYKLGHELVEKRRIKEKEKEDQRKEYQLRLKLIEENTNKRILIVKRLAVFLGVWVIGFICFPVSQYLF